MKNAIVVHGMPTESEYKFQLDNQVTIWDWLPWLKKNLESSGIEANVPEMPKPYEPNYSEWKKVFEQFTINENTILIGHSCGGGFLIRYLSENNINVGKVMLVAPWLDPEKYFESRDQKNDFFNFKMDQNLADRTKGLHVFYSTDDDENILQTIEIIKQNFGDNNAKINYHEFTDRGHFTTEPGYNNNTLPEVLEICLK